MIIRSPGYLKPISLWAFVSTAMVTSFGALSMMQGLLWIASLIAGVFAIVATLEVVTYKWAVYKKMMTDAESRTEEVRKLEIISNMNKEQFDFLRAHILVIRVILGNRGRIKLYNWMFQEIPDWFVSQFIEMGEGDYLCPIREFPEGSAEREWARALTDLAVNYEWAIAARGNKPAMWINYDKAIEELELVV